MTDHVIVPEGQELPFAEALAGPIYDLEPVCPLCGHVGATRIEVNRLDPKDRYEVPCYLSWCAAHGVLAPIRPGEKLRPYESVPCENGRGTTSKYRSGGLRCGDCGYTSTPSAFCKPVGPAFSA